MPTSQQILEGLRYIANAYVELAILWHLVIAIALVMLATRRVRPSQRVAAVLLVLPLLSVAGLAWMNGNPFNGLAFSVAAIVLTVLGARLPSEPVRLGPRWAVGLGALTLAYAWVYPHFLDGSPWLYTIGSPLGLVPCPTMSAVVGFGLLAGGFDSRSWSFVAAGVGVFYALFGMLRLGVWLDAGLLVASTGLAALAIRDVFARRSAPGHSPAR
jgi:hypothetical protein